MKISNPQRAIFGDGDWAYWARLAHLRIVAGNHEPRYARILGFWRREESTNLSSTDEGGSYGVVTNPPLPPVILGGGWPRLGNTPYYIRWLKKTVEQSYSQRNE
jgi:hypothetical protein